ncbi:MAG: hypothetical protein GF417_00530, partial [Candidatus Latescibacteria bacterium]|nr:hypothetical protein [bacterium]MBD3422912.1 hypothetical protein [Candidatus Latescibacterota bacterium]
MKQIRELNLPARWIILLAFSVILAGCAGPAPRKPAPPGTETETASTGAETTDAEVAVVLANQAASNQKYEKAAVILENQLRATPHNAEALRLLARVYAADGRSSESASAWKKLYSLERSDPDAAYQVASELALEKNWPEVGESLDAVEAAGTADSRHYLLLGEANLEIGYRNRAEEYLEKASDLPRAKTLLGELYYGKRRYSRAQKTFRSVLEKDPGNYSANLHLGYI